jgi:hypothetical protein
MPRRQSGASPAQPIRGRRVQVARPCKRSHFMLLRLDDGIQITDRQNVDKMTENGDFIL